MGSEMCIRDRPITIIANAIASITLKINIRVGYSNKKEEKIQ